MKLRLSSGVILNCNNESIIQQHLKYGAAEVKEEVSVEKEQPKRGRKKSAERASSLSEAE